MTLTDAIFGPLTGTPQVEFAVLNTLETWLPTMLRVIERRLEVPRRTLLDPPGASSYIGGIDFDSWVEEDLPTVIAVVQPSGEADRTTGGYSQWFDVEVAAVVVTESEDESRALAGHLGTAIVAALIQHGDLGGIASITRLVSMPIVEFPDDDTRKLTRARAQFSVYVEGLPDDLAGPKTATPPDSPEYEGPDEEYSNWPTHLSTHVTVTGINAVIEPPTGDRAGGNVSVVFSEQTAASGSSGTYRVRTATFATRFSLGCTGAPVGSPLTVEALKNGVVISTLVVPDGTTTGQSMDISVPLAVDDLLSVNATSVGSMTPAASVTAQIDLGN